MKGTVILSEWGGGAGSTIKKYPNTASIIE